MKLAIHILEKELTEYRRCKQKSVESFWKVEIDWETHATHLKNLEPKLEELQEAIRILGSVLQ